MGIGFTIDTPLKVAHLGIDSVISLVDDILIEKLRKMYSEKFGIPYNEINEKFDDFRAQRITSYLNMVHDQVEKKFEEFKNATIEKRHEIKDYFNLLPDTSELKAEFNKMTEKYFNLDEVKAWLRDHLSMGSIDVNIMTKIDKDNYKKGEKLPIEYNDAHAALRGFATSKLESSVVISAGMSPRLYSYIEQFDDFYPNENGYIKKKIILKVSDFRSALVQGKFFAKKGLWVSEYRIESGLNCGGHAFATEGHLLGPILSEFKENRETLNSTVFGLLTDALNKKGRSIPKNELRVQISAQGGVGTAEEHQLLLDHFGVNSVGWGSPFLLVPEVTNVDDDTLASLSEATEDDLYLSDISPLGVPFNSLRGNTKDIEKLTLIEKGVPGSLCPKRYLSSNREFSEKQICTASRRYQRNKIEELDLLDLGIEEYKSRFDKIVEKSCICVGLGTSVLKKNNLSTKVEGNGVSVCPGPNMAYFSKITGLKEMVDHIYGRINLIQENNRPNMFIKELGIYIDYLKKKVNEYKNSGNEKQEKSLINFTNNLKDGIQYYHNLFDEMVDKFEDSKSRIFSELENSKKTLQLLITEIENHYKLETVRV